MNLPLPVNDTVGPSVPMKCGANGKTAKANVCGPIFANFSAREEWGRSREGGAGKWGKRVVSGDDGDGELTYELNCS